MLWEHWRGRPPPTNAAPFRRSPPPEQTTEALRAFASEGLRTLVLAQREIPEAEYTPWAAEYRAAFLSLQGRACEGPHFPQIQLEPQKSRRKVEVHTAIVCVDLHRNCGYGDALVL